MEYHTVVTSITVLPVDEPVFSERATIITMEDEGGGLFLSIEQTGINDTGKITIDKTDWPHIRSAIEIMFEHCEILEGASGGKTTEI